MSSSGNGNQVSQNPGDIAPQPAISAFLVFILGLMIIQSIPPAFFLVRAVNGEPLMSRVIGKITPYAVALGVFQAWNMFAPNPMRENTYIDAEITYGDGRQHIWSFPQMHELGYFARYAKERYRKFANERLWIEHNSPVWPDAARYIARLNNNGSNVPRIVKLIHYRSVIPDPPMPGEEPVRERWERHVFFTYPVKPEDLP